MNREEGDEAMDEASDMDREEGEAGSGPPRPEPFRILFVCTGNTCRSPMAEAIARRAVEERGWRHVEVSSAGVSAFPGVPASGEAVAVAESRGLDLSRHESSPLTEERVREADLILAMASHHVETIRRLGGEGKGTLLTTFASGEEGAPLAGGGGSGEGSDETGRSVPDPIGGTREEYAETFRTLERLVADALRRLEPIVAP